MDPNANLSGLLTYGGCGLRKSGRCDQCDSWRSHDGFGSCQPLLLQVVVCDRCLDPLFRSALNSDPFYCVI